MYEMTGKLAEYAKSELCGHAGDLQGKVDGLKSNINDMLVKEYEAAVNEVNSIEDAGVKSAKSTLTLLQEASNRLLGACDCLTAGLNDCVYVDKIVAEIVALQGAYEKTKAMKKSVNTEDPEEIARIETYNKYIDDQLAKINENIKKCDEEGNKIVKDIESSFASASLGIKGNMVVGGTLGQLVEYGIKYNELDFESMTPKIMTYEKYLQDPDEVVDASVNPEDITDPQEEPFDTEYGDLRVGQALIYTEDASIGVITGETFIDGVAYWIVTYSDGATVEYSKETINDYFSIITNTGGASGPAIFVDDDTNQPVCEVKRNDDGSLESITYYEDGQVLAVHNYDEDVLSEITEYYERYQTTEGLGPIRSKTQYENGRTHIVEEYGLDGRLSSSTTYNDDGTTTTCEYEYDGEGNLKAKTTRMDENTYTVETYDKDGKIVIETNSYYNDENNNHCRERSYTTESGSKVKETYKEDALFSSEITTYGSNGALSQTITRDRNGEVIRFEEHNWDDHGNEVIYIEYKIGDAGTTATEYYYTDIDTGAKVTEHKVNSILIYKEEKYDDGMVATTTYTDEYTYTTTIKDANEMVVRTENHYREADVDYYDVSYVDTLKGATVTETYLANDSFLSRKEDFNDGSRLSIITSDFNEDGSAKSQTFEYNGESITYDEYIRIRNFFRNSEKDENGNIIAANGYRVGEFITMIGPEEAAISSPVTDMITSIDPDGTIHTKTGLTSDALSDGGSYKRKADSIDAYVKGGHHEPDVIVGQFMVLKDGSILEVSNIESDGTITFTDGSNHAPNEFMTNTSFSSRANAEEAYSEELADQQAAAQLASLANNGLNVGEFITYTDEDGDAFCDKIKSIEIVNGEAIIVFESGRRMKADENTRSYVSAGEANAAWEVQQSDYTNAEAPGDIPGQSDSNYVIGYYVPLRLGTNISALKIINIDEEHKMVVLAGGHTFPMNSLCGRSFATKEEAINYQGSLNPKE